MTGRYGAVVECLHGMDERDCATCKHGPEREPAVVVEAIFKAQYRGDCSSCRLPIVIGQILCRLSNDRYVHQGCE